MVAVPPLESALAAVRPAEVYNYIEVALWPVIGVVIAVHGFRRTGAVRRDCIIAAVTLVAFGATDWFEANTGNEWWHPWWLLLWKASCVAILLGLLLTAWQRGRRDRDSRV